jgi:hypothetical protein
MLKVALSYVSEGLTRRAFWLKKKKSGTQFALALLDQQVREEDILEIPELKQVSERE